MVTWGLWKDEFTNPHFNTLEEALEDAQENCSKGCEVFIADCKEYDVTIPPEYLKDYILDSLWEDCCYYANIKMEDWEQLSDEINEVIKKWNIRTKNFNCFTVENVKKYTIK